MKIRIVPSKGSWSCAKTGKGRFVQRLIPALRRLGAVVVEDANEPCDVDLGMGKFVYEPKRCKRKVIRLGAAHIDSNSKYKKLNNIKWQSVKRADGIIYQSKFSKKLCRKFIGDPGVPSAVIYNGSPLLLPLINVRLAKSEYDYNYVVSTRKYTPQKRVEQIALAFINNDVLKDAALWIFGDSGVKEEVSLPRNRKIIKMGQVADEVLFSYLIMRTAMIHCVYADACSNSVVEALACGGPVICTDQGGTAELVKGICDDLIIRDKEYNFKPINFKKVPKLDQKALVEKMVLAQTSYNRIPDKINITNVAAQYIEFFEKLLSQNK